MDRVDFHKLAKKERGLYPAILNEQASIKDLLYGFRGNFSCGILWVVPSRQDSSILPVRVANQRRIWFILARSSLLYNKLRYEPKERLRRRHSQMHVGLERLWYFLSSVTLTCGGKFVAHMTIESGLSDPRNAVTHILMVMIGLYYSLNLNRTPSHLIFWKLWSAVNLKKVRVSRTVSKPSVA